MKIGHRLVILINLFLILNITLNSIENSMFIEESNRPKNNIKYLIYKISEQNEEISYLSDRVANLDEQIFKLIESRKKYILKTDVIDLIKEILEKQKMSVNNIKDEIVKNKFPDNKIEEMNEIDKDNKNINNYDKALEFFKKGKYILSEEYFKESIKNNYKEALSLFYLGEIFFIRKLYKEAFSYLKKSIQVSKNKNNISFLPNVVYLHIGISLYKLGVMDKAENFFKYVIENFPNSISAREAYIFLKKI